MPKRTDNEREIARRAAEGDAAAFSELYLRHRDQVYAFAYRMVRVQAVAEDITHEAFLVLVEHPERYDAEKGSMLTFLCGVARNQILYYLRRHRRDFELEARQFETTSQDQIEVKRDPLRDLLDEELTAQVNAAINTLPIFQREVIVLREFQELSYGEIATVTGVEISVVKARLHRARQLLARRLAPYLVSLGDECHELR